MQVVSSCSAYVRIQCVYGWGLFCSGDCKGPGIVVVGMSKIGVEGAGERLGIGSGGGEARVRCGVECCTFCISEVEARTTCIPESVTTATTAYSNTVIYSHIYYQVGQQHPYQ